jgi:hypothetical protein
VRNFVADRILATLCWFRDAPSGIPAVLCPYPDAARRGGAIGRSRLLTRNLLPGLA